MAESAVSICSAAIESLGGSPISSFTDGQNAGRANRIWPSVVDWLLRSHAWNAATKRVVLTPDTDAPAFEYTKQFTLPADFVRLLGIGDDDYRPAYRIESGKVLAAVTSLKVRYVWRNDNPATWDAGMVQAATAYVASRLAYAITNSASVADAAKDDLRDMLRQAKGIDGGEQDGEVLGDFPLYAARF